MTGGASGSLAWGADDALPGFDPVSAWSLVHGRDFVPMLWDRMEATDDFDYVAALDAAYPTPGTGTPRPPLVIFRVGDLQPPGAAKVKIDDLKTSHGMVDPRFYLMPLRRRMLAATGPVPGTARIQNANIIPASGAEPKALIGVIDHGINVLHERFRNKAGASRVAHAWWQGAAKASGGTVPFGRDWTGAELTGLLAGHNGHDATALREMGALDFVRPGDRPLAFRQSHGTTVLDLAAGADPKEDRAVDILAVSLPPVVVRASAGELLTFFLLQAFEYLLARTRTVSASWGKSGSNALPLYVNASFGVTGGPRGGAHQIDMGIAGLIAEHEALGGGDVTVVIPSGNRNLAQGHARNKPGTPVEVAWRLTPGDRTSNHIDARITGSGPVIIRLDPPGLGGLSPVTLNPGEAKVLKRHGAVIGRAVLADGPNGAMHLGMTLGPTATVDTGRVPAPSGAWSLSIEGPGPSAEIHAWILRDDGLSIMSFGGGQSYFEEPGYRKYTLGNRTDPGGKRIVEPAGDVLADDLPEAPHLLRQGALNALATHPDRVVVGGYRKADSGRNTETGRNGKGRAVPSLYSAGPLEEGRASHAGEGVTVSAVSDRSRVLGGVMAASTLSGGSVAVNGTSVAAPQVARLLASETVSPENAKAFLAGKVVHEAPLDLSGRRTGKGGI